MNGQLMEAIQQKVALSQELDQWQVGEIIISNGLDFKYRKRPYITCIDALSAPLFAPQTWGEKT